HRNFSFTRVTDAHWIVGFYCDTGPVSIVSDYLLGGYYPNGEMINSVNGTFNFTAGANVRYVEFQFYVNGDGTYDVGFGTVLKDTLSDVDYQIDGLPEAVEQLFESDPDNFGNAMYWGIEFNYVSNVE